MTASVPRQKDESVSFELTYEQLVRRLTKCRFDLDPLSILKPVDVVEPCSADDPD
jgi:hypothetical protein